MTQPFLLTIADVALEVSSPHDVDIVEFESWYSEFLRAPEASASVIDVPVRLRFDSPPPLIDLPQVFDTGAGWKAFRDGEETVLAMPFSQGIEGYLWVMRLGNRNSPCDLFWSPELLRKRGDRSELFNPVHYPLDQILIMHLLARRDGLIVHSAGFHRDGVGAFFAGVSGAGKSTLTELLAGRPDLSPLSDDRVIVRRVGEGIRVFGTPWPGEAGVAANESAELGAMVFLRQADSHGIRELNAGEALKLLLPTASVLWYDAELVDGALSWCDELLNEIPAYELSFARDEGVAEVVDGFFRELV